MVKQTIQIFARLKPSKSKRGVRMKFKLPFFIDENQNRRCEPMTGSRLVELSAEIVWGNAGHSLKFSGVKS
jgi:hypothetical protein